MENRIVCHVCGTGIEIEERKETPTHCRLCDTDLINQNAETRILLTVVRKEAAGIRAGLIVIYLTDKRLAFMQGDNAEKLLEDGPAAAFIKKTNHIVSIPLKTITSVDTESRGLFRGKMRINVHTNDDRTYSMTLPKRVGTRWVDEINRQRTL